MKKFKQLLCLLLCIAMLLSTLAACTTEPDEPTESTEATAADPTDEGKLQLTFNTEQPAGRRANALSLNGTWEIQADTKEKETVVKVGNSNADEAVALNGNICGMHLQADALTDADYVKARAFIQADGSEAEGAVELKVQVNGGEWIATDIAPYCNNMKHWVDLRVRRADLKQGANDLEITTDSAVPVQIYCNAAEESAGYLNGSATGRNYLLRLRVTPCPDDWKECTVPTPAEASLTVSYADVIRPETYNGVVWYRKSFSYTAGGATPWLCFNAVDYKADVWLNGEYLGSHEGDYLAFAFCVADFLRDGENELIVRVVDQDWNNGNSEDDIHIKETLAGFAQDTRKLNYCGIWQSVYIEERGQVAIQSVYARTIDETTGEIELTVTLANPLAAPVQTKVSVSAADLGASAEATVEAVCGESEVTIPLTLQGAEPWSPDAPNLYAVTVTAAGSGGTDTLTQKVGLSRMRAEGNKLIHNGEPVFLTGMLHWGSYYENYTSAISAERVRDELTQLKAAGFNAVKYCLFSPPEYILDICDEMGIFVYIEYPIWNAVETDAFFERAYLQMPQLIRKDRVHACVVMTDFNCEDLEFTAEMDALMGFCVSAGKTLDPNRLFTDNSSNGEHKYGDYATCHPYYQVDVFETMLEGWINERGGQPLILGEYADISVLRDIGELNSLATEGYTWYHDYYTDVDHAAVMRENGYSEEQIDAVIEESVQNAQELRKYYIEAAKSFDGVGGLFLTHISESANGWADGWLDDLYQPHFDNDYIKMSAEDTALLLPRDTVNYWQGKEYSFTPAVSLYGGALDGATLTYTLSDGTNTVLEGTAADSITLANGGYHVLCDLPITFPETDGAVKYTLRTELRQAGETVAANEWMLWAYPQKLLDADTAGGKKVQVYDPSNRLQLGTRYNWMSSFTGVDADLVITTDLNGTILNYLSSGGKVIYVGADSGVTEVTNSWDYNRLSFAFAPDRDNALVKAIANDGYGGLQFVDLATQYYLEQMDNGNSLIGRFNITTGVIASYVSEYACGAGTLLQTTLRLDDSTLQLGGALLTHESLAVSGENVLGAYLLDQMIRYELSK